MFKQGLICTALLTSVFAGAVNAQEPGMEVLAASAALARQISPFPLQLDWTVDGPINLEETAMGVPSHQPNNTFVGQAVLTSIVNWLTGNFDLPASSEHPRVELTPAPQLTAMRHSPSQLEFAIIDQPMSKRQVLSAYDSANKTIYLPDGWTGRTPEEQSLLVHEMVHHLQNLAGRKYECPQEREKLAYVAQERWLSPSGRDLKDGFGIDPLTLLLRTECHVP